MKKEELLLTYLMANCAGRKNIRTRAQIQRALGLSKDQLTDLVHKMRCKGVPIAGGPRGTTTPRTPRISISPSAGWKRSSRPCSSPSTG